LQVTGSTHYLLGNVGIGTASPSYNLDVTGTGRFTGALTGASATFSSLTVDNNFNGSTWVIAKNQNAGSGAAAGLLMTNNTGDLGAISLLSSGNSPANGLFIRTLSTNSLILGTNSTTNLTIASGGAATFSSSVTAGDKVTINQTGSAVVGLQVSSTNVTSYASTLIYATTVVNGSNGFDLIGLYTNGTARFRVDGTGAATFSSSVTATDVEATNQFITSGGNLRIVNSGGQVGMNWTSASGGDLYFRTASTERLRITSTGNVGIGTTSPSALLHTYKNNSTDNNIRVENGTAGYASVINLVAATDGGAIYNYINSGTTGGTAMWQIGGGATTNTMVMYTGGVERMRIQSNGYVAIGSTSANAPLDVTSASTSSSGVQQWSYSSSPGNYRLQLNTIVSSGLVKYSFDLLNSGTAYNNNLVLDRGNVGIGTTSPNAPLHLYKSSGNVVMTLQTSTSYGYVVNDGTNVILASDVGSTGFKFLVNRSAPDNAMVITSAGNVGIGISSPSAKLFVTGSTNVVGIQGSGSAAPLMYVDGSNGRLFEVTDDLSDSLFSVNTIAGLPVIEAFANNCVTLGQYGGHQLKVTSTSIAGGKCSTASGTYSFVGGGLSNTASGACSAVVGGSTNTNTGTFSFIGAGQCNRICNAAGGTIFATLSGGYSNTVEDYGSTVGGGVYNNAISQYSTVGGGYDNCTTGYMSVVSGGRINFASACYSTVGGGCANTASGGYSTVSGGQVNIASGCRSTVGGGKGNSASGYYTVIAGGANNTASNESFIGGGANHTASGYRSIVVAGRTNSATGCLSTVGGGDANTASGVCSTIGGGYLNKATSCYTFVGGGGGAFGNFACGAFSVAVGGNSQRSGPGAYTVIVGGNSNCACCNCASVVGGSFNKAIGQGSFIGAGTSNTIGDAFTNSSILGCGLTAAASTTTYVNALSKTSGTFRINHPDPSKTSSKYLQHSFVESPTRGDNIYRYKITTCNCEATLLLPDYYKFLNENDQVWVSPICHFGSAYGIVDSCQTCITFTSNCDGDYNVLLIGTRKDTDAKKGFLGVEVWK
jgi:hypothetical protein